MKHAYFIPTNRNIDISLSSYVSEVNIARNEYGADIDVIVLDSGNNVVECENRKAINGIRGKYPDVNIVHIPWNVQCNIVNSILKKAALPDDWQNMFVPSYSDYGAMMNRIYIMSIIGGYDVIHRRDSDTEIQAPHIMPLLNELRILNNENNNDVAIVGSGYVGEWNLDIRNFAENNMKAFSDFLSSLSIPVSAHDEYMKNTIEGSLEQYSAESDIKSSDESSAPEAGNFAMRNIHLYFPCLAAKLTLGTDYLPFKIAGILGYKTVFHKRRVCHLYHASRHGREYYMKYLTAIYKLCDHSPVYWSLMQTLMNSSEHGASVADLVAAASAFLENPVDVGIDYRESGKKLFLENIVKKYFGGYYDLLQLNRSEIDKECNKEYVMHSKLICQWSSIVQAADEMDFNNYLKG